jgi:hypothetical protein
METEEITEVILNKHIEVLPSVIKQPKRGNRRYYQTYLKVKAKQCMAPPKDSVETGEMVPPE